MILSAKNLSVAYNGKTIVPDASFDLVEGQIACLIGPNGCGKSTLLKAIAGVINHQHGSVTLGERPLSNWPRKELARELAFLPQNPIAPDDITVHQLVLHGRYAHQGLFGKNTAEDIEAVERALKLTSMYEFKDRSFNTLSGGERQRGWISLFIAQQAKILLLDEPTTYLDIGHQYETLKLLAKLNSKHNLTILMVLHDINQASQFADRILTMHRGQIIADDSPINVINENMMETVFGIKIELQTRQHFDKTYPIAIPLST